MIVPNLLVTDMARSFQYYRDILGMTLTMTVSPEREVGWPGEASGAAFAMLEWDWAQLMLQTVESLAGSLRCSRGTMRRRPPGRSTSADCTPGACGTA